MSAQWECQKVLYTQLKNDATFMGLISNRLYDEPPTNEQYPYVLIGDSIEIPDDDLSHRGYETDVIFNIYTKPAGLGFYTAKTILNAMNNVLNLKKFDMTGFTMIICKYDNAFNNRNGDKRIITVRYKVLTDTDTLITY